MEEMVGKKFVGQWRYLNEALFGISADWAEKACFELALFLRMLDDEEDVSAYHAQNECNIPNCGRLILKNGSEKKLPFREVANKVLHSSSLEWDFSDTTDPKLLCNTRDDEKWLRAEVSVVSLAAVCGQFMS
ncbi:MAG TPA: hypothetical protein VN577_24320 [Terriglobales bacterium]|nr:hypothetical protein [Terriglobales bacterium]